MKSDRKPKRGKAIFFSVPVFVLAYFTGINAVLNATRAANPATALTIDANDAGALVKDADTEWAIAAATGKPVDVSRAALRSLRGEAINPRAVRLLAFAADARGNKSRAEQFNLIAARFTRRESGAQLWLMENSVARNDVAAVLARYDVLLRTNTEMQPLLYPKLSSALSDPEIRNAFVPYIRKAPPWLIGFMAHALGMENPDTLSFAIRQAGGLPKTEAYQPYVTGLLARLFAQQKYAEGHAFYHSLPGSDAKLITSSAFTDTAFNPKFVPMSWLLESNSNVESALEKNGETRAIRALAFSGTGGVAASKHLFVPPGVYRFGSEQTILNSSANSRAAWILRCMSTPEKAVIYQYDIIRTDTSATQSMEVTIPTNCSAQRLELVLAGGDASDGQELRVAWVEIGS
jgi:hypothetical protein